MEPGQLTQYNDQPTTRMALIWFPTQTSPHHSLHTTKPFMWWCQVLSLKGKKPTDNLPLSNCIVLYFHFRECCWI